MRQADVSIRYILQTVDKGLKAAIGTTTDFTKVTRDATKALSDSDVAWRTSGAVVAEVSKQISGSMADQLKAYDRAAAGVKAAAAEQQKAAKLWMDSAGEATKSSQKVAEQAALTAKAVGDSAAKQSAALAEQGSAYARSADRASVASKTSAAAADIASAASLRGARAVEVHSSAWTKLSTGLTRTGTVIQDSGKKMKDLGSAVSSVGTPIAAIAAGSVYLQMKFQAAMETVHTQAGYSQQAVNRLSKEVLAAAPALAQTPQALAAGLYHIASVGVPASRAMDVLKASAVGANISGANFDDTANALVTTLKNFPDTAGGARGAMAQLNEIAGQGNLHMEDLVTNLGKVVPAAKNFGLTLRDVGTGLDVMTQHGINASQASTALKMAITTMGAPSTTAAKELATVGLSSTQLASDMRKPDGLVTAFQDLKQHLVDSGLSAVQQAQVMSHAFGGGRTGAGVMLLTQNIDDLRRTYLKLPEGAAALKQLQNAQATWEQTSQAQYDHVKATVESTAISIGSSLEPIVIPALKDVATGVKDVAHVFEGLPAPVKAALLGLAAVSVIAGPVLKVFGGLTTLVGGGIKLFGKLAGAVAPVDAELSAQEKATLALAAATDKLAIAQAELATRFDAVAGSAEAATASVAALDEAEAAGGGISPGMMPLGRATAAAPEARAAESAAGVEDVGMLATGAAGTATEEKVAQAALQNSTEGGLLQAFFGKVGITNLTSKLGVGKTASAVADVGKVAGVGEGAAVVGDVADVGKVAGVLGKLGPALGAAGKFLGPIGLGITAIEGATAFIGTHGTLGERLSAVANSLTFGLIGNDPTNVQQRAQGTARADTSFGQFSTAAGGPMAGALSATGIQQYQARLTQLQAQLKQVSGTQVRDPMTGMMVTVGQDDKVMLDRQAQIKRLTDLFNQEQAAALNAALATDAKGQGASRWSDVSAQLQAITPQLDKLTGKWQDAGALASIKFAAGLEQNGRLPRGATDQLISDLEAKFPPLAAYLQQQGATSMTALEDQIRVNNVQSASIQLINQLKTTFGWLPTYAQTAGSSTQAKMKTAMGELKNIIATGTAAQVAAATPELAALEAEYQKYMDAIAHRTKDDTAAAKAAIEKLGGDWSSLGSVIKTVADRMIVPGLNSVFSGFNRLLGLTPPGTPATGSHQGHRATFWAGGRVPGDPTRDGTLILASGNEFMLTGHGQEMMESYAPGLLAHIESSQLPHFAAGGRTSTAGSFTGTQFTGPVSTFGPPAEASSGTAYGSTSALPGIAINPGPATSDWNSSTATSLAGHVFLVSVGGHQAFLPVIDKGPSALAASGPDAGRPRTIDITGAGAAKMGYQVGAGGAGFPTDSIGSAREWAGKVPGGLYTARTPKTTSVTDFKPAGKGLVDGFDLGYNYGLGPGASGVTTPGQAYMKALLGASLKAVHHSVATSSLTGARAGSSVHAMFAALGLGRTDQGLDFTKPGSVPAIGPGRVNSTGLWTGWPGTGGVVYSLTGGPKQGEKVYVMEHFAPGVRAGQSVQSGQVIGQALPGYPWIETGFANTAGTGPITTYGTNPDGTPMAGGIAMKAFLGFRRGGRVRGLQDGGYLADYTRRAAGHTSTRAPRPARAPHAHIKIPHQTQHFAGHHVQPANLPVGMQYHEIQSLTGVIAAMPLDTISIGVKSTRRELEKLKSSLGTISSTTSDPRIRAAMGLLSHTLMNVRHVSYRTLEHTASSLQHEISHINTSSTGGQHEATRLKQALALVDYQMGVRVGKLVAGAVNQSTAITQANTELSRLMERDNIDPASAQGTAMLAAFQNHAVTVMRSTVGQLQKAYKLAVKSGDTKAIADVSQKLASAIDNLDQGVADQVQDARNAVEAAAQQVVDKATAAANLAASGEQDLEVKQQLAGTYGTPGGASQIASYYNKQVIPALTEQMTALQGQYATAKKEGDTTLATQIAQAIADQQTAIDQAKLSALQAIQNATQQTADALSAAGGQEAVSYQGQSLPDLAGLLAGV